MRGGGGWIRSQTDFGKNCLRSRSRSHLRGPCCDRNHSYCTGAMSVLFAFSLSLSPLVGPGPYAGNVGSFPRLVSLSNTLYYTCFIRGQQTPKYELPIKFEAESYEVVSKKGSEVTIRSSSGVECKRNAAQVKRHLAADDSDGEQETVQKDCMEDTTVRERPVRAKTEAALNSSLRLNISVLPRLMHN